MKTDDFDYSLPDELIAQSPAPVRDACKMLVVGRESGQLKDCIFRDILKFLRPGDLLVANETRVRPARLLGHKEGTGGAAEVFLLRPVSALSLSACGLGARDCEADARVRESEFDGRALRARDFVPDNKCAYWEALVRPGKRLKPGAVVCFEDSAGNIAMRAEIVGFAGADDSTQATHDTCKQSRSKGERLVKLTTSLPSLDEALHAVGNTPLPPYIKNYAGDKEMYQTVYSRSERSAAAPTAGLHFTPELIERVREAGIGWETVDLEVGLDTFRIVDEDDPKSHQMHTELFTVPERTVQAIEDTKRAGGRVIAVGTTSVRSLESAVALAKTHAQGDCLLSPCTREATNLYILPGYKFRVVDGLITNFHVPRSTLLMLVSAFSTREKIMRAYAHAIEQHYRFFSFGDAMFII